jgi:signal transduction histidine kinase
MRLRHQYLRSWTARAAACLIVSGFVLAPLYGSFTVSAFLAMATAVLMLGRATRPMLSWSAAVAAGVSVAASAVGFALSPPRDLGGVDVLGYAEMATLMVIAGGLARWAPVRRAVVLGIAIEVAVVAIVLRMIEADTSVSAAAAAIACVNFSLGTVAGVVIGGYLRLLDERRMRSVTEAERDQRLQLAQDLHDFVAHEVGAIVAQAQAGQLIATRDPELAVATFERVERAGLRALSSMDKAVDALARGRRPADRTPPPALDELAGLAARFSAEGQADVVLDIDPDLDLQPQTAGTAYRIVVEALTNVRRHAPGATRVEVRLRRTPEGSLNVAVTDDGRGAPCAGRGGGRAEGRVGGRGLAGLAERVHAVHGSLTAGPDDKGWQVSATLPATASTGSQS